jgi:hypothetical protein
VSDDPATLRLYAAIFKKEWRAFRGDEIHPPTAPCVAAARALRYLADAIERGAIDQKPGQHSLDVEIDISTP